MKPLALITGASSGIGRELARIHAARGGDLIVVARREDSLNALRDELEAAHGVTVHVIAMDLAEAGAAEGLHAAVGGKGLATAAGGFLLVMPWLVPVWGVLFLFGGTPEFLMDPYRGLYSYEALQTRLAENRFAQDGLVDLSGPVIRLQNLSPEDLYVLLGNIRRVFAGGEEGQVLVPDTALQAFMRHCAETVGDAYFRTPRNTVRAFTDLLAVLEQNPGAEWEALLGGVALEEERNPDLEPLADDGEAADGAAAGDDDLTSFQL